MRSGLGRSGGLASLRGVLSATLVEPGAGSNAPALFLELARLSGRGHAAGSVADGRWAPQLRLRREPAGLAAARLFSPSPLPAPHSASSGSSPTSHSVAVIGSVALRLTRTFPPSRCSSIMADSPATKLRRDQASRTARRRLPARRESFRLLGSRIPPKFGGNPSLSRARPRLIAAPSGSGARELLPPCGPIAAVAPAGEAREPRKYSAGRGEAPRGPAAATKSSARPPPVIAARRQAAVARPSRGLAGRRSLSRVARRDRPLFVRRAAGRGGLARLRPQLAALGS